MFNKIAGHAKSAFQSVPVARQVQSAGLTAARVAPGQRSVQVACGAPRACEVAPSVRSRSISFLFPNPHAKPVRDWPAAGETGQEIEALTTAGTAARRAALEAPRQWAAKREREELAFRSGVGIEPGYAAEVNGINMVKGLERSRDMLLKEESPGVAAGLRELAIAPGDAVGELDPLEPTLAVHLALEGARTGVVLSSPARHRELTLELKRFEKGKTHPVRIMLPPDFKHMHPPEHYSNGARKVARQMSLVEGKGFGALPQDTRYKALIARGVFEYLDLRAIEAALDDAGRMLQPGGGLVFEFAHAAGTPSHPQAPVKLNRVAFRQLDEAARRNGLALKCINVQFRQAERPDGDLIPPRRVAGDARGEVAPDKADAAALTGWNEIARLQKHEAQPVMVDVSGVFIKQGSATR